MDESKLTPAQKVRLQLVRSQIQAAIKKSYEADAFEKAIKPVWYQGGNQVRQLGQSTLANAEVLTNRQYDIGSPMAPRPTKGGQLRIDNKNFLESPPITVKKATPITANIQAQDQAAIAAIAGEFNVLWACANGECSVNMQTGIYATEEECLAARIKSIPDGVLCGVAASVSVRLNRYDGTVAERDYGMAALSPSTAFYSPITYLGCEIRPTVEGSIYFDFQIKIQYADLNGEMHTNYFGHFLPIIQSSSSFTQDQISLLQLLDVNVSIVPQDGLFIYSCPI